MNTKLLFTVFTQMFSDSSLRYRRYINHLLTYLLTYLYAKRVHQSRLIICDHIPSVAANVVQLLLLQASGLPTFSPICRRNSIFDVRKQRMTSCPSRSY